MRLQQRLMAALAVASTEEEQRTAAYILGDERESGVASRHLLLDGECRCCAIEGVDAEIWSHEAIGSFHILNNPYSQ